MIRTALLTLLLSGCVQVVPLINSRTDVISCCEVVAEFSKTTDGTLAIQNGAKGISVKVGARTKF